MKKFWAWFCIVFSYLFTYTTPIVAAYFLLAEQRVRTIEGKSGVVYYFILGVFGLALFIAFTKTVLRMKANLFKSLFKTVFEIGFIMALISAVKYLDLNYDKIITLLCCTLSGFGIGNIFEMIAVSKYKAYIREVGVF